MKDLEISQHTIGEVFNLPNCTLASKLSDCGLVKPNPNIHILGQLVAFLHLGHILKGKGC